MTTMTRMVRSRVRIVAAALGVVLLAAVAVGIVWLLGWDWKALIGWRALEGTDWLESIS
jgi:hypothetical protein